MVKVLFAVAGMKCRQLSLSAAVAGIEVACRSSYKVYKNRVEMA
jgi:hypothetical protein